MVTRECSNVRGVCVTLGGLAFHPGKAESSACEGRRLRRNAAGPPPLAPATAAPSIYFTLLLNSCLNVRGISDAMAF